MAKKKPAPKKKPATKQIEGHMDISEVVALAQRIHDAEHINLGSASTREYRNAFWARVIGCVHHGHKVYNPTPDKQWHLKSGGGGRPQSDDVAVSMPSKQFWDCIPGSGADGYSFRASGPELLDSPPQVIFAPPVPEGSGVQPKPTKPTPQPQQPVPVVPDRAEALDELRFLDLYYSDKEGLQRPNGLSLNGKPDFEGIAAWFLDVYQQERIKGKDRPSARNTYVLAIRNSDEWRSKHPGETP